MTLLSKKSLINIRKSESAINKNLFLLCAIITVIIMLMLIIEFFSRGAFLPSRIGFFYIGILFIYSVHKEMLRWLEEKKKDRRGECFLYSWITLTVLFYVINFFTKDYFSKSLEGKPTECISEASVITLEVAAIFFLARLSKIIKIVLMKKQ